MQTAAINKVHPKRPSVPAIAQWATTVGENAMNIPDASAASQERVLEYTK